MLHWEQSNPYNVLNVEGTINYDVSVANYGDNAIPNRKYVDRAKPNDTANNFKIDWTYWAATPSTTIGYTGTYGGGIFIGDIGSAKDTNILIGSESGQNIVVDAQLDDIGGWNHYGVYNVAIGQQAGLALTTGTNNVYLGNGAGGWQTYGDNNIAIGAGAGANTAFAGTGDYIQGSIAIGCASLGNSFGDDNIGIGYFAGNLLGGGGGNVIIGFDQANDLAYTAGNVAISDNRFPSANRKVLWDLDGKMTHYGIVEITTSSVSVSSSTGALRVRGGVGIRGNLNVGGSFTATGSVNVLGTGTFKSLFVNGYAVSTGSSGGSALTVKDEGTNLTTGATSLNFVGSGVIATVAGNDVTVTISGGGGGGSFSGGAVPSATQFLDASVPTSSGTGAVSVVGGIGVGGDSFFGAGVTIKSAAPSVASTNTGALTVVGGVGIGGGLFVANAVTATNIRITSTSTSAVSLAGGITVAGSATVVGSVTAGSFITGGSGVPVIQSPSSIILDAQTEVNILGSPLRLWSRTVDQLITQTVAMAGAIAFCTNESGGATPVFYDGTYWRKFHDRGIIS